jgi:microcystin synthetase protein McyJ
MSSADSADSGRYDIDHELLNRGGPAGASWMNLGDWEQARSYPEACAALARRLGRAAGLGPGQRVLDVGFGAGDQLLYWRQEFGVAHVHGREVRADCVQQARRRVEERGEQAHVTAQVGSATELGELPAEHFERVVCLDAAYHFHTRESFFREARRVLVPGGRLALTDVALEQQPQGMAGRLLVETLASACAIPRANLCTVEEYQRSLEAAGYGEVRVESVNEQVLEGFAAFARRHRREHLRTTLSAGWAKVLVTGWACGVLSRRHWLHYLVVSAVRQ